VQHARDAAQARGKKRRHRRITAEADHHRGLDAAEQRPGLGSAQRQRRGGACQRNRIAPAQGRARDNVHGAGGKLEMGGARVGGELDDGAALLQSVGERLRREQMPAGSAGREEDELIFRAHYRALVKRRA
jgi:hypothetical protein